ncbi:hypothetical protein ANN_18722 [Periplaneta americana]|uniref:Uncharacterized protein n=1 Tax=Periplaneta americana TaxID=6978 RepID=A0ABQ8SRP1_PERAM|nr:hypothetical protein ANN_18722 [Periplaneta americana]
MKRAITTVLDDNVVQVLKAANHDHPLSLEEVEALRRCIRLKRAAENESVAGPAQIIQRELEGVPSGAKPLDVVRRIREPQERKYQNLNVRLQNIASLYVDYKGDGNIIGYLHACGHNMAM